MLFRDSGKLVWQFDTVRAYEETVNDVEAHGGIIDNAGIQEYDDIMVVQSGYRTHGQMSDNAVLMLGLADSQRVDMAMNQGTRR